jgi:dTMP kinase
MKKSGVLICFIGIDGSGKSTLSKNLIERMSKRHIKFEYTWCKFESSFFKLLISLKNKYFIRDKDWKENYTKSRTVKKKLFHSPYLRLAYEWFILIDYRFQILRKITIPRLFGRNFVSDRYIYDTVVDLAFDLNYTEEEVKKKVNHLLFLSPKPDIIYFVDVPESVAFSRKNDVPSINFLSEKKKVYKQILKYIDVIILDGTSNLNDLNFIIDQHLAKSLISKDRE